MIENKEDIIVIGNGGHARACKPIIEQGYNIIEFIDKENKRDFINDDCCFFVAIGNNEIRKELFDYLNTLNKRMPPVLGFYSTIYTKIASSNSIIMNNCMIGSNVNIKDNCIINSGAIIEHDCTIGSHTHISTGAIVNGGCTIGNNCLIGSGTVIRNGTTICDNVTIGMGARVVKNIPSPGTYINYDNLRIL